jgi:hypothetical protein
MADSYGPASAGTMPKGQQFKTVSQMENAEDFSSLLEKQKRRRLRQEIDWRLNIAYARGNQYVYWNPVARKIEQRTD